MIKEELPYIRNDQRLGPMPPQLLVLAAVSADVAAAASPDRAVMASPGVGSESLRRRRSWDSRRRRVYSDGETALQRCHGSPCSAFLREDGASEWSFETNGPERLVWADLYEITRGGGFQKK